MERKTFLKLLGVTSLSLSELSTFMAMNTILNRKILSSNENMPVIGLGTWRQFDVSLGDKEKNDIINVLKTLNEYHCKLIDSSPMYNRSESVVGELLKNTTFRDNFFYATKVWTQGREEGIKQIEQSFKNMKRNQMDLLQIHNLIDWEIHLDTLRQLKAEKKIRYIGITHYLSSAHDRIESIIKSHNDIDFVQINYNIIDRNAEKSLLNTATERGVSVIVNRPFEGGELFRLVGHKKLPIYASDYGIKSWGQFFLKYILSNPAITCIIPGTSNPIHLLDNIKAGYGELPNEMVRSKMIEVIS